MRRRKLGSEVIVQLQLRALCGIIRSPDWSHLQREIGSEPHPAAVVRRRLGACRLARSCCSGQSNLVRVLPAASGVGGVPRSQRLHFASPVRRQGLARQSILAWNYPAALACGRLRAVDDACWLYRHLAEMTDVREAGPAESWALADVPAAFARTSLGQIVDIEIRNHRLWGKWKVSQNQNVANRLGVIAGLQSSAQSQGAAFAEWVIRRLPRDDSGRLISLITLRHGPLPRFRSSAYCCRYGSRQESD